jgi:carboxyl-terminal processing protease
MMYRVVQILGITAVVITMTAAGQTGGSIFEEVRTIIEKNYIDPFSLGTARVNQQIDAAAKACANPCTQDKSEATLSVYLERLGDYHLMLRPALQDDATAPNKIGGRSLSTRYGFDADARGDDLIVTWIHPDFPAAQAGLNVGDRIVAANNSRSSPKVLTHTIAASEYAGRALLLEVSRHPGVTKEFRLKTSTALLSSYATVIGKATVISIPAADGELTDREVYGFLKAAIARGSQRVILDLRYHAGGNPFTAVRIASAFLPTVGSEYVDRVGTKIKYSMTQALKKYENSSDPTKNNAETIPNWTSWRGDLKVLVSQRTESIGETLAFYIQNAKRGVILGEITAGGGGVLGNSFKLQNGATLFVSTHRILSMNGDASPLRVTPDASIPLDLAQLALGIDTQLQAALR